jgi:hypothetical protein
MTATATGNPPLGQAPPPEPALVRRRRRIRLPRASTTPGKLQLVEVALVVLCLAWGALAAFTISQHASAASNVAGTSEPISLDAQQMYQSLADADVTVSTGYLYGRIGPFADRQRYQRDIAIAAADLQAVTSANGSSSIGASLSTLTAALPIYTGYVEDGEIYNSLGYPAGGSFIEVASEEMHLTLLPAARDVYTQENAQLTKASAQATGLPLAIVALAAGLVTAFFLFRTQRWLSRRTHRTLNAGLLVAFVAVVVALVWLVVALASGRSDLLQATGHGSTPAETVAQADIAALQARGDETLNLISRSGDADFQADFRAAQNRLNTLLPNAAAQSTAQGASQIDAARSAATAWFAVNRQAQALDAVFDYGAETRLEIGSGPGAAGTLFGQLETDLGAAINTDQGVFASNAAAGSDAFTGLEAGLIVLALAMAFGCIWGLSRRIAEYR